MISQPTRVAVLFERLGPYHHARLNAAGRQMRVFGLEACGVENTYAWEKVEGAASFTRLTLTDRHSQNASWRKELHRQTWKALDETKPQAVAVPGWASTEALSALSWCLRTKTPAVMMSESTEWDERREPLKEWVKRRLVGLCSAALVGGTPHADYLKKLGLPPERVFLGYDAVDNDYFEEKAEKLKVESGKQKPVVSGQESQISGQQSGVSSQQEEARNRSTSTGLRPPSPQSGEGSLPQKFFLASARFIEKKNLARLLQAYALYRTLARKSETGDRRSESANQKVENRNQTSDLCPPPSAPWSLVLLGDGPLKSDLCHLISDLRLDAHVHLPGFKQYHELPVYYGLASAFVHASTTEQWGLVVNEAMASGLPVLVSNRCGCAQDLVKEGVNGFTFDPCNIEQLAQLMLKLSTLNNQLSTLGSASRELISQWGPERFASGLKSAVESAMGVGPKRAGIVDRFLLQALLAH
jgi:1,2-diacylglycerol 3-alpha-glucosyltransferase